MRILNPTTAAFAAGALLAAGPALAGTTTFSSGTEGWQGPMGTGGTSFIDTSRGNPVPSYRTQFYDFGVEFWNDSNPSFVTDYTQAPSVTISIDVYSLVVGQAGGTLTRGWYVELRDFDDADPFYGVTSVIYRMGAIQSDESGVFKTFSVTIDDTSAVALQAGWIGYGDEDPDGNFKLPDHRTFASVLAGVDEIAFHTFDPYEYYPFTNFDVAIDNVTVSFAVPEPAAGLGLLGLGAIGLIRRR